MEVLEASGYVSEEKAVIADKYLGPRTKDASGLKAAHSLLDPDAVDDLIQYYCRESGVRNLKKDINEASFSVVSGFFCLFVNCSSFRSDLP